VYEYKSVWVVEEVYMLHGIPKTFQTAMNKNQKRTERGIKIIHNNVPGLDITYVEGCEGKTAV